MVGRRPGRQPPQVELGADERARMGRRVRHARLLAGLTHREAAALIGANVQSVSEWELHGRVPTAETRARIARVYNVPQERLFAEVEGRLNEMWAETRPGQPRPPGRYVTCAHCGLPLLVVNPKATRLRYHAECAREHDRLAHAERRSAVSYKACCVFCGQAFDARRSDARYCSDRCRTAAARARRQA